MSAPTLAEVRVVKDVSAAAKSDPITADEIAALSGASGMLALKPRSYSGSLAERP
jgi:hypothetical protein